MASIGWLQPTNRTLDKFGPPDEGHRIAKTRPFRPFFGFLGPGNARPVVGRAGAPADEGGESEPRRRPPRPSASTIFIYQLGARSEWGLEPGG